MGSLLKNTQLILVFFKAPFMLLHFFNFNDVPDAAFSNATIYADDTTLYSKYDEASDFWQN